MNRFKHLIEALDYQDLQQIKKDLDQGGIEISSLVVKRLQEKERQHGTFCVNCHADIDPSNRHNCTLIFGPIDFRKKASFCALDCLEYFISGLKKNR